MSKGVIDQVKVRVRTHAPKEVWEQEFHSIEDAIWFLQSIKDVIEA